MLQNETPRLILASSSGARRALLAGAGLSFTAMPARLDEDGLKQRAITEGASAEEAALLLAGLKAERIGRREPDALVIGADQILVCDGRWFSKPDGAETARAHLQALRGRTHELVTAVVCHRGEQRVWHHVTRPRLTMRAFSDAFLAAYVAAEGAQLCTSVGAYRMEGPGIHLFEQIAGDHGAILGLPLLPLLGFLRQHGVVLA